MLQACIIYTDDYNGPSLLTAVNDFIGKEQLMSITDFLSGIMAIGNDEPVRAWLLVCKQVIADLPHTGASLIDSGRLHNIALYPA